MNTNRNDPFSGCVSIYSISVALYYGVWIFLLSRMEEAFSFSPLIYISGGALLLYLICREVRNRCRRKTAAVIHVWLSVFYILGTFVCFSCTKETHICGAGICAILSYCGYMLNTRPLEKVSAIARFEITAIVLLFTMLTLELKDDAGANMLPMVIAVIISLAEVTRLGLVRKKEEVSGRTFAFFAAAFFIYAFSLGCAVLAVKKKAFILGGLSLLTDGLKRLGAGIERAIAEVFEYVLARFSGEKAMLFWTENGSQDYVREEINPAILIILAVAAFLLIAAAVFGIIRQLRKRRSLPAKNRKRTVRHNAVRPTEAAEQKRYFKKARQWKFLLIPASDPRAFLFKAARICRKTPYRMKDCQSPRQFVDKLLSMDLADQELEKQLRSVAEQIDLFYYSDAPKRNGYKREEGQRLLRELRAQVKRERRQRKKRLRKGDAPQLP